MLKRPFQPNDSERAAALGIPPEELQRQLDLLRQPPPGPRVIRPCTVGDGIRVIGEQERESLLALWRQAAAQGRLERFVPASGAATRMFRTLRRVRSRDDLLPLAEISRQAHRGDAEAGDLLAFIAGLRKFAFYDRLAGELREGGEQIEEVLQRGEYWKLIDSLLDSSGLAYGDLPKGLIDFHLYPEGPRTAFTEHLVEAAGYLSREGSSSRSHFTISPGHRRDFEAALERSRPELEDRLGISIEAAFSHQSPATDTLALDADGALVRHPDGTLLLRPAGHGSLISNLQRLGGDLVLIKNIDNIAPERLHRETASWKRLLIGHLVFLQQRIFTLLDRLEQAPEDPSSVREGLDLLRRELNVEPPESIEGADGEVSRNYLADRLDRPLRVCGMVRNQGEPGGGPFRVAGPEGGSSGQIVEASQLDLSRDQTRDLLKDATHFNPVDLACALRDRRGRPYDLELFVDPQAVFVSSKTHQGRPILALERPGLWNGAMARWNSAFVEVPVTTFTPVKTVLDLLRPEHLA